MTSPYNPGQGNPDWLKMGQRYEQIKALVKKYYADSPEAPKGCACKWCRFMAQAKEIFNDE